MLVAVLASLLALASSVAAVVPLPAGAISGSGHTVGFGELKEEWRGEIIHLSWSPRAFLLKGFLSDEECDHLINKAKPHMEKSMVADNVSGKSIPSTVRTSTGTFFEKSADEVVRAIEKRIAQVTMIPAKHQEGLQILHYHNGQKYEPHYDYFHDQLNTDAAHGGQRVATILMYLTTVDEGGETVFPNADKRVTGPEWSSCAKQGLAVKTVRGDALMFYSLKPDGALDQSSLHGSCPVVRGEKWSATCWIHVAAIPDKTPLPVRDPTGCHDDNEQCAEWAFFGECEKNEAYMKVTCRKSCGLCKGIPRVAVHSTPW